MYVYLFIFTASDGKDFRMKVIIINYILYSLRSVTKRALLLPLTALPACPQVLPARPASCVREDSCLSSCLSSSSSCTSARLPSPPSCPSRPPPPGAAPPARPPRTLCLSPDPTQEPQEARRERVMEDPLCSAENEEEGGRKRGRKVVKTAVPREDGSENHAK